MNQSDNLNEMLPVVDENGNIIDAATRGECHGGSRKLHPVVHLHVFNSKGELYLQKRPGWKDIQPGKWDTAVGGHVDFGENVERALVREVREELGIELLGMKDKLDEAKRWLRLPVDALCVRLSSGEGTGVCQYHSL